MSKVKNGLTVFLAAAASLGLVLGNGISLGQSAFADGDKPVNGNYYFADFDTAEAAADAGDKLNKEILSEGITLLKNENSLPLKRGAKISLFGKASTTFRYGGAGSGAGSGGDRITVKQSLERAGLAVNEALWNFYSDNNLSGKGASTLGTYGIYAGPGANGIGETPVSSITKYVNEKTFREYGDAAIIVIARQGNESSDTPKGMSTGYGSDGRLNKSPVPGAHDAEDHYLQLDQNEADLIKFAGERFDNVIVLFNTGSQIEAGFLDDPNHYAYHENVKGAMWIGYSGNGNGLEALGEVIAGKINPSGHTVDTYARDFKSDPTWANMATYTNNLFKYSNFTSKSFVNYTEGIYSGYRYYETRGYTQGNSPYTAEIRGTTTTQWNSWYNANVVYPFGYGLSYTEFDWQFVSSSLEEGGELKEDGAVTLKVKVTNTGDYAGKDVVQLYYTAPYTAGGIEKAHVVLGDYVKTDLLEPGESQTVTLCIRARDMASYDYSDANENGFCGYELEAGEYGLKISRNAHDVAFEKNYVVGDGGFKYVSGDNGEYEVKNRFEDAEAENTVYLSRNDWENTFPHEPTAGERTALQWVINEVNATSQNDKILEGDDPSKPYYAEEAPVTDANNGVKLEDLYGLEFDDPLWGKFLNQLTVGSKTAKGTMANAVWVSGWTTAANDALGIPKFSHEDGPSGIAGRYVKGKYTNFASETVTASTWNKELAYRKGLIIGNQGMFGNGGANRVHALYAPACNIHRSPFGGRNFEYFSEDALLSGEMAGQIVRGCNDKGMVTFVKHFAVNDQESNRDTLLTWANEQTIREIYLRPFQICVEKYNSHGIMSALNSLGAVWTGGHYALLTEVLRNEWGFKGVVITDYVQNRGQLNGNMALRAGGDILLATDGSVQTPVGLDRPTTIANLRRAAHNLYYTIVNHTAAFNAGTVNVLGSFAGGDLSPAIDSLPYEQSVATVTLNNGKSAEDVTYELKEGSKLPEGLTLSSEGVISGTAKLQSEAAEFTVVAKYGYAEREATYTLPVVDKSLSVIYIRESETINGSVSGGFNESIDWAYTLDGKKHEITYKLAEGCILPEGLSLSENGVISGKSAIPFTGYEITVIAESAGMLPMRVRLTLNSYKDFSFASSVLPTARCGRQYAQSVTAVSDGTLKYSLKLGSTLPQGLSLTAGGTIVGVPQEAGVSSFTVVVTGANCPTTEKTFTLSVGINYSTFSLGNATVGVQYETYVNTAQGAVDIGYTLTGGKLPRGVTLSRDGVLSGTPKESGNFAFTVTAVYGDYSDSVELVLHVDEPASNAAYVAGLTVGVIGIAGVVAACVVYVLVIDKRAVKNENGELLKEGARVTVKQKIKRNKSFVGFAGAAVCVMMAVVITCGVVFAPVSQSGGTETYTFEAEYVYLDDFMGAGISNSGEGVNNIYGEGSDEDKAKGWSNGYFLGNTYAVNSITFEITSDRNAEGKLILRLASELGALALNNEVFGIAVNGKEVDYSFTVANSAAGSYDFADYLVAAEINLAEGVNEITLSIKENTLKDGNGIGAPLIDCIKITTEAGLSWNPLTDNPDNRGKI